jgi:hypothetical protein
VFSFVHHLVVLGRESLVLGLSPPRRQSASVIRGPHASDSNQ